MALPEIDPALVVRFKVDLQKLTGGRPEALGVAVSGGPDSLALLLLAAAAYPGRVHAATVDHGLREESAEEAAQVARICERLDVPHATLKLEWPDPPGGNIQARARDARYHELAGWGLDRSIPFIATGHHVNDQAETVLMRLARGSGVSGLAGARRTKILSLDTKSGASVHLIRPLLDWRREELAQVVADAEVAAIDDPSNADDRYDRTRIRALLAGNSWLESERLADSAGHLADAEEAIAWAVAQLTPKRLFLHEDGSVTLDPTDLPRELQRRLLLDAFTYFTGCNDPSGPKLARLLDELRAGRAGTLAEVKVTPGPKWHLDWAPPRRTG